MFSICRNISQNKELVKNGFNGYIFKNDDELEKIFKKINNLSNYKKISNNAELQKNMTSRQWLILY